MRIPSPVFCLILAVCACQTASPGAQERTSDPDHITQDEIAGLENSMVMTARQVIQRLRPSWLRPRSSTVRGRHTPVVFRDGMRLGELGVLDDMDMREIWEFRYLSASDATNRYGTGYPGGIIVVSTRRNR